MTIFRIELPLFVNLRGTAKVTGSPRTTRPFKLVTGRLSIVGDPQLRGDVGVTIPWRVFDVSGAAALRGLFMFQGGNLRPISPRAFDFVQKNPLWPSATKGNNSHSIVQDTRRRPDNGFEIDQAQPRKDKINLVMTVRM